MIGNNKLFEAGLSGERIYRILDRSIINIRMMMALAQFDSDNWEVLKTKMNPLDCSIVFNICSQYFLKGEDNLFSRQHSHSDEKLDTEKPKFDCDSEISIILKILQKHKAAAKYCLSINTSEEAAVFLQRLEELKNYMKERISKTAEMEKKHKNHLKQLYEQNVMLNETLKKLKNKLDALESQQKTIKSAKESDMTKHKLEIDSMRKHFNTKIREKIEESEGQMAYDWKNSEFRQTTLIEEVTMQQTYFDGVRKERLVKEKDMRVKRYKVESQLVAVLEKYDLDIGERHRQKEELTAQLEEEKYELEQLQERFDEQEVTYNNLMTEKELHEKRIFDEKIYNIRSRMAARIIQRRFRKYLERKAKSKKKGKKGKKK